MSNEQLLKLMLVLGLLNLEEQHFRTHRGENTLRNISLLRSNLSSLCVLNLISNNQLSLKT